MCWEGGEANWVVGGGGGGKESLYANPSTHNPYLNFQKWYL